MNHKLVKTPYSIFRKSAKLGFLIDPESSGLKTSRFTNREFVIEKVKNIKGTRNINNRKLEFNQMYKAINGVESIMIEYLIHSGMLFW